MWCFSSSDGFYLNSSFSPDSKRLAYANISFYRHTRAPLPDNDLKNVQQKWVNDNLVLYNQGKSVQIVISHKQHSKFPHVFMNGNGLEISTSFIQLRLSGSTSFIWKSHIFLSLNMHLKKLFFPEPVLFSPFTNPKLTLL